MSPGPPPPAEWSREPVSGVYAWWSPRIHGRAHGRPVIRVNRALQAPATQVRDEVLELLLWHELCHHLAPAHGHDAEFRRLEAMFPGFATLDSELQALPERYDVAAAMRAQPRPVSRGRR